MLGDLESALTSASDAQASGCGGGSECVPRLWFFLEVISYGDFFWGPRDWGYLQYLQVSFKKERWKSRFSRQKLSWVVKLMMSITSTNVPGEFPLGGWFQIFLEFSPGSLGKWSNLTSIFFKWVGEKPPTSPVPSNFRRFIFDHGILRLGCFCWHIRRVHEFWGNRWDMCDIQPWV